VISEGGSIFFEKKKQKTFGNLELGTPIQLNKIFLLLFFKKDASSFTSTFGELTK